MAEMAHQYNLNKQAAKDKLLDPKAARDNIGKQAAEAAKTDMERKTDAYKMQCAAIDANTSLSADDKARLHSLAAEKYINGDLAGDANKNGTSINDIIDTAADSFSPDVIA